MHGENILCFQIYQVHKIIKLVSLYNFQADIKCTDAQKASWGKSKISKAKIDKNQGVYKSATGQLML